MKAIVSHLWFDTPAKEAALFYCSLFPNSHIDGSTVKAIGSVPSASRLRP